MVFQYAALFDSQNVVENIAFPLLERYRLPRKEVLDRVRQMIERMDDPTTGLDPIATKNVDNMIRRTADEFGVTSVVISHDMASTFRIGDRIAMLYDGAIVSCGTPTEIMKDPHPVLREFVEMSGAVRLGIRP
jgi:phospholipid/cholesterol/gamma-HCH transport system ATP-binding protein